LSTPWAGLLDFCLLGGCLVLATVLRARIGLLQKWLVPNNIVAGFLGYFLGGEMLGLFEIPSERFGAYVYHLLAITFIAVALRDARPRRDTQAVSTGFVLAIGIGVQTVVGLLIAFLYALLVLPGLFPAFGYYLMLGFSQGPGQAYSLGRTWEPMGLADAGNIGLSFAAIGYIWACVVGVALVYIGLKKKRTGYGEQIRKVSEGQRTGIYAEAVNRPEAGRLTTASSAVDGLAFHLAVVGLVYLAAYLLLKGAERLILTAGDGMVTTHLTNTLWGIHFVFASFLAIGCRRALNAAGRGGILDDGLLTRISGTALDFMVTAAIAAVSIAAIRRYAGLILVTTTVGGLVTVWFVIHAVRRSGMSHTLERIASIYGTMTGTLSTGLTLARIADPEFESPAPQALVFGAAVTLPLVIPLILSSFIPLALAESRAGPWTYYPSTIAIAGAYTLVLYIVWRAAIARRRGPR